MTSEIAVCLAILGVAVILVCCILTGVYVYEANQVFDPMFEEIVKEASK